MIKQINNKLAIVIREKSKKLNATIILERLKNRGEILPMSVTEMKSAKESEKLSQIHYRRSNDSERGKPNEYKFHLTRQNREIYERHMVRVHGSNKNQI